MKRFARPFLNIRPFRPTLPVLAVGHGLSPITKMGTLSNAADGKPTAWHGAGAAEFDLRSESDFYHLALLLHSGTLSDFSG
jgi:threonine aldolase